MGDKGLAPKHFHGHPDGSYSVCDCQPPTVSVAEKERVMEQLCDRYWRAFLPAEAELREALEAAYDAGRRAERLNREEGR